MKETDTRLKIAIETSYMDRRPGKGTAILIRHSMEELKACRNDFDITLIHKEEIPEEPLYKDFKEIRIRRFNFPKFSGVFSELWFFLTSRKRFDVYYFSYSRLLPTFWLAPARHIVFAAMDGGPETSGYKQKAKGRQPWWVRMLFWRISAIIAISEFGKKGIISAYGLDENKVHVVPCGVDEKFFTPAEGVDRERIVRSYGLPAQYILCVSRFDPHKNIIRLLEAYAELCKGNPEVLPLVFVGGRHMPEYSNQVDETITALHLGQTVSVAPYIAEEDLPTIYAAATIMVFPSLYEGFGLPVVESMAAGTPVLVSNIDALTEVSGNHAVVVDPYDVHDISQGMKKLFFDSVLQEENRKKGKEWARRYSWNAHREALVRVFDALRA